MPVALIAAAVATGGSLINGSMQADAAKHAANAQANAAANAQALQKQEFDQTQTNLQPWMTTGQSALQQVASLFGLGPGGNGTPNTAGMQSALQNYPGYQFALNQGEQGLDRVAASRGLALSGAQLKDSQAYGQGLAQNTFGQYLSGLQNLSTQGLGAAGNLGNFAQNYANNSGQMQLAQGQAQASGIVGQANALTSGLQGALGNSLYAYNAFGGGMGGHGGMIPESFSPVGNQYGNVAAGPAPGGIGGDLSGLSSLLG